MGRDVGVGKVAAQMNMHDPRFFARRLGTMLACACSLAAAGCSNTISRDFQNVGVIRNVTAFKRIPPFTTLEDVSKILGAMGRHQFRVRIHDDELLGVSYRVEGHNAQLVFVFTGGELVRISPRPHDNSETRIDENGDRHMVFIPTDPDKKLAQLLVMPNLMVGDVAGYLSICQHPPRRIPNVLVPYMIAGALNPIGFAIGEADSQNCGVAFRDLERQMVGRYDPWLIDLNDSEEKVTSTFGEPLQTRTLADNKTLSVYGYAIERPWKVSVVYNTQHRVTAIYTGFFSPSAWIENSQSR